MSHRPVPFPTGRRVALALLAALVVTLVAAIVAAPATPAEARTGRPRGASGAGDPTEAARTVAGAGVARVRGVPDVLTMVLGVTSRGRTVGEALDRNNAASSSVTEVLLDGGVDKRDLQTSRFSIGPVRDDRSGDVTGYEVSNLLTVRLRDLGKAGTLVDRAAQAGGDDVIMRGVSFGFDDTSDLVAQARSEAVKRARSQAEQLAQAAGVELGEVLRISESSRDVGPVLDAPEAGRTQAADVTIEPGTEELSVHVSIVFSIR